MTQDITSLIEKLEGASEGSVELDMDVLTEIFGEADGVRFYMTPGTHKNPTRSLDAALALAERMMDQRGPININICLAGSAQVVIDSVGACDPVMAQTVAATPALALCAALLRTQSEAR